MKTFCLLILFSFFSIAAISQKVLPAIKAGTNVTLDVDFHGQSILLNLNYKSLTDPVMIGWDIGGTSGTYAMPVKSLESGKNFDLDQPDPSQVTLLRKDETFMCISKAAYLDMQKNKGFTYNDLAFTIKDNPDGFKLNGRELDATYLTTANGKTSLWILNNPDMPLTLSLKGNPGGVDYVLTIIE